MTISINMKRIQKTKDLGCPVEIELETGDKQGVYSDLLAMSKLKTKSKLNTENLLEKIVDKRNFFEAYKKVVSNKGSSGIDGMRVDELLPCLQENYETLKESLLSGEYKPLPVRRVEIPKPNGGIRLLGIPTVIDRLIQQAINQIINPIFDKEFSNSSYGFRPGRSAHMALGQAQRHINEGYKYVVDMDLEKFFDKVNHDILMNLISEKIESGLRREGRLGLKEMLEKASKGQIDYILVKSISRLSRDTLELLKIIRDLRERGINMHFETENLDSIKLENELEITLRSVLAQEESKNTSENIKWDLDGSLKGEKYLLNTKISWAIHV